jgi:4-hydroxybenzoyl-CoA thioesterase/acyl-CoA thioester hydrolase
VSASYLTSRRVEFRDTDAAGILHFASFFAMMEEAEHELLRQLGLSVLTQDESGVISWPRVSANCDFQKPVRFEDVVDIEIRIARLGTKSVTYAFRFTHDGRQVAEGSVTTVCCRIESNQPPVPIAIPESIRQKLTPYVASADAAVE